MLRIVRILIPIAIGLFLASCVSNSSSPRAFDEAVTNVYIGMTKAEFESVMHEVNEKTKRRAKRRSEAYQRAGRLYEISYVRSGWVADGAVTDDEYTPYLFQDGVLVGYGWATVGGRKTDSANVASQKIEVKVEREKDFTKCRSKGGDGWC